MKYGNRPKGRKFMSSPVMLVLSVIVLFVLAKANWNINKKAHVSSQRLEQAKAELVRLETHEKDLEKQINLLSTPEGIEAELREKYRAVKNGESVAVIINDRQAAAASESISDSSHEEGFFKKMLHKIGL